jgi:hypothetical protein
VLASQNCPPNNQFLSLQSGECTPCLGLVIVEIDGVNVMLRLSASPCLASGAAFFSAHSAIIAGLCAIYLGAVIALIVRGVRSKKRWWWWIAWTLAMSFLFEVVTTYWTDISMKFIFPLENLLGL